MAPFDYNCQTPSAFCFLVLIRTVVLNSPLSVQNLDLK